MKLSGKLYVINCLMFNTHLYIFYIYTFRYIILILVYIVLRYPQAARNYTHLQTVRRVGAMRSLRRPCIPEGIHELAEILNNPQYPAYSQMVQIPPSRFF